MIHCKVSLEFDIGYCMDDFETEEEWQHFCEKMKKNEDFIIEQIVDNCHYDQPIHVTKVEKWEVTDD